MHQINSILRRKQVENRTGLSRSTIYLRIKEGTFPKPISLGARAVGWLESEIEEWLDYQIKQSRPVAQGRAT
jgi:prophage regulatory protein